jgi:small subunit ribosomal protein S16
MGSKGRPYYRIVVAPTVASRGGRFVEQLGTYDPLKEPSAVQLDKERTLRWLKEGAQFTETIQRLLEREGIMSEFEGGKPPKKARRKPVKARVKPPKPEPKPKKPKPAPAPPAEGEPAAEAVAEDTQAEAAVATDSTEAPAEAEAADPAADEAPAEPTEEA